MRILSPKLLKILTFYFGQNCAKIQFAYHPDPELLELAFYITNNSEQCKSIFFKQKLIHFHFSMRMPLMYLFRWMAKKRSTAMCIYLFVFLLQAQSTKSTKSQVCKKCAQGERSVIHLAPQMSIKNREGTEAYPTLHAQRHTGPTLGKIAKYS